jgi:hypothetical protein
MQKLGQFRQPRSECIRLFIELEAWILRFLVDRAKRITRISIEALEAGAA